MLDIAVIGAGRIGRIHARNIAAHAGARLVGITDPDTAAASRLAAACGCQAIALDAAFDAAAVLIASPTPTHAGFIERAAAAGRAVFCEKPIDLDAARARACVEAAERAGITLMVGFNRRFDPNFAALKAALDAGGIGAVEVLAITSRDPGPPPPSYVAASGGLFRDMAIHDLDMARFLLDEAVVDVFAAASCLVDPAIGDAGDVDTALITLRTASGRLCSISNSRRASYGYDQRIEAHGATGMLRAGNVVLNTLEQAGPAGFTTAPAQPFFLERYAAAYRAELDEFVAAVTDGRAPRPDGRDGLAALLLADAAAQSLRTGRAVRPGSA
ncbi:MAG: inositol 2-dehydrogenase [Acetobacteraceae bacterium]|nr:inositol 2-dehydrogenase [Acetobacteraceae bacterium]